MDEENWNGKEKRQFTRFDLTAFVDYAGSEVLLHHHIENISLGGICIKTDCIEDVGTLVDLVIHFPDLESTIAVQGKIIWVDRAPPQKLGIQYMELDNNQKETLRKYITALRKK